MIPTHNKASKKQTKNRLMVVKADKGRMIVIINEEQYKQKTINFINKNKFQKLEKTQKKITINKYNMLYKNVMH
jgi:hypothetical protein